MKLANLVLLTAWIAEAGSIRVLVHDPSGAVIVNAAVEAGGDTRRTSESGEALFDDLPKGRLTLRIEADGFTSYSTSLNVKDGRITIDRTLALAARKDRVEVAVDPHEAATDPRTGGLVSTVLSEREIEQLPDDTDEMQRVLEAMAGPGAVFRVDGFRGGRLPHKSQIQSIRFRLTPYSAEEHDDGFMTVDIVTKPGLGIWHGSASYAMGDTVLNARNAFAPRREAQQARRFDVNALGPLWKNHTSSSFTFTRNDGYDSRTTIGVLPEGPFSNSLAIPQLFESAAGRIQHALTRAHSIRGEYRYERTERGSLGSFDLPERLSTSFNEAHVLRLSGQGSFTERLVNEYRFEGQWSDNRASSLTQAPAVIVQGAFARGGANADSSRIARGYDLTDHLAFHKGKHAMSTGVEATHSRYRGSDFTNGFGTTVYPDLAAYLANQPALLSRRSAPVTVAYHQTRLGVFFQDDIRMLKNLSLSLGLRAEGMSQVDRYWNPAPRVGFAWAPFKKLKMTLRGGAGIYYQWFDASLYEAALRLNGALQVDLITSSLGRRLPGFFENPANLRLPYTTRFSGGVQQTLPGRLNLMLDFRQERTLHAFRSLNVNPPGSDYAYLLRLESAGRAGMRGLLVALSSLPGPDDKGWRGRTFFGMHYFLLEAKDETSNPLTPPANSANVRADWGPSASDIRHRLNLMLQEKLPLGFQLGTALGVTSGAPYDITSGFDQNHDTFFNDRPAGVGRNAGRGGAGVDLNARLSWSRGFGHREGQGGSPTMVRIRAGGPAEIPDLPMGQGNSNPLARMQLYAQASNALNHFNPAAHAGVVTSPFFGLPVAAQPPRRIELGMKWSF